MPKRDDLRSILVIGAGPIVIGQACEFDYSGTQACKALRQEGYRVILVNSNPATIMTDPETADVTYIEPVTPAMVAKIIERERPDAVLPTMGGQTALNVAMALARDGTLDRLGVELIGASPEAIAKAEDRELFRQAMIRIGLDLPRSHVVQTLEQAREAPVQGLERARALVTEQRRSVDLVIDAILRANGRHAQPPDCDALHQPAEGELLLGLFPRGDGWLVFAHDDHETTAHAVVLRELDLEADPAWLSQLLLQPVAEQVERAERIRVHAVGQAQRIDVEKLPWNGQPLHAHAPVAWGVDVAAPARDALALPDDVPRALLVADPSGSLPEAEAEVQAAAEQLARAGWIVEELAREDARPHVVQERMAAATLLHYAGHATHDQLLDPGWWPPYAGGTPSWPASLRLANDARLGAHEILTQSGRVPRTVILSGCQTGAIETATSGTSLAVAFLVAGAEEVIATTTVTTDAKARVLLRGVYEGLGDPRGSLVDALAGLDAEARGGFRVWVR